MLQDRKSRLAGDRAMMSTVLPEGSSEAAAPRAGADLAAARERMGRSLPEMADMLRIRLPFLDALEHGRLTDLPGTAYALGFLRIYALALGLDPEEMARRFKTEAAAIGRKPELAFPAPLPDRGLPAGALMLLGLVLAVGVYAGWYRLSGEGRLPAETVLPVPARLASLAAPHVAVPRLAAPPSAAPPWAAPGPVGATGGATAGGAAPGAGTVGQAPQGTNAGGASPLAAGAPALPGPGNAQVASAAGAAGLGAGSGNAEVPSPAGPPPDVSPGSAAAATPTRAQDVAMLGGVGLPAAAPLTILATADSWVQVRDATGAVVFSRLLHGGDSWAVPARPGLVLTTGNAGGTELVVNGVAGAPLGQTGAVLRNVPLVAPGAGGAAPAPSSSG